MKPVVPLTDEAMPGIRCFCGCDSVEDHDPEEGWCLLGCMRDECHLIGKQEGA